MEPKVYVYVLQGENCFSENGDVCWIEGVYSSQEKADAAKKQIEDEYEADGFVVCGREDEDGETDDDWDRCFTVFQMEVE